MSIGPAVSDEFAKVVTATFKLAAPALVLPLLLASPVLAQEAQPRSGEEIFTTKCIACHAGGQNTLNPKKTLTKEALKKYGYDTEDKITEIVSNGKAPMPKYAIKSKKLGLSPEEISNVANYVLERSEQGWKK
eukprot:CAMPEP_0181335032 /NCGR_PEP_ID=MMETSP1101-20121128/26605_1 /TAXON_ID=46948 /ORGANISM="Rhodomonas abbreviata, Strain Caron Lab Isolate" /LENGTH=132 /DNA_ID=CAMNT_0023445105 /DNA_START=214 /DNA_END=612 /DNA_ORIENTATION=+